MKRTILAASFALFAAWSVPALSSAEINLNVGINLPPAVVVSSPSELVVVPGTYVYFAPDLDADIVFYGGRWYRSHGNRWYRSGDYGGPWVVISIGRVPRPVIHLPRDYRAIPPGHERIPYGQLKKHWKQWEREKHWERAEHRHHAKEEWKEHKRKRKHKHGHDD